MKLVTAIIRPERCQPVKDALKAIGHCGMTITHVYGRGQQAGIKFTTRVGDMVVDEIEKTKLEIILDDDEVDRVVDAIVDVAWTGRPGDGVVSVTPVERFLRIRESHEKAGDARRSIKYLTPKPFSNLSNTSSGPSEGRSKIFCSFV